MSKRVAKCGLLIALAMVFSYVEVLIPFNFGIPGIKLGLANLIVVVGFYSMKTTDVIAVSIVRIFLSGLLFGNLMSILYSLSGGILSIIVMLLLKRLHRFSIVGVSIAGGVFHNIGQIIVAMLILENFAVAVYLPPLLIAGTITGMLIGTLAMRMLPVIKKVMQKNNKEIFINA